MIMNIKLNFVIRIVIVLLALSQSTSASFRHLCHVVGANEASYSNFRFSVNDLPDRCEAVFYGNYNFDFSHNGHNHMYKADEDAIRSLVRANIPVITYVGFIDVEPWGEIVDSHDQHLYDLRISPLIEKIKALKLSGIVLSISDIYSGTVTDYASKISMFMTNIKSIMPTLQFGLYISATNSYDKIINQQLFDFTITNSIVDMYIIQMFTPKFKVKSSDCNALSLKTLCDAVYQSSMDKDKTYANMYISVSKSDEAAVVDNDSNYSYSKYRKSFGADKILQDIWLQKYKTTLYEEGALVQNYFYGVSASWLDYDDSRGYYLNQKFPATNALFDGFDGVPLTPNENVDNILSIYDFYKK